MSIRADELHRTAKLFVEEGVVANLEDAVALLETYVLQVDVGTGIALSPTRQAMVLTIVNTARRAFLGGVHVRIADDSLLTVGWAPGLRLSEAVTAWGGQVVRELDEQRPTVAIGTSAALSALTVWPTWNGWSGGIVVDGNERLAEQDEFEPAGAMAGAMGVSECFQRLSGNQRAARRSFGVSLWRPELDWRNPESHGPRCAYLPREYWLPGLGHLGQALAWIIALLPYEDRSKVSLLLQDYDVVTKANESTSLLADISNVGVRKTRVVSQQLEDLGFRTAIVERAFDEKTHRTGNEPLLVLAGFDKAEPRRALGGAGFDRIVDAGLGSGTHQYLEMLIQSFASDANTTGNFVQCSRQTRIDELLQTPAYGELAARLMAEGQERGDAECGVVEIAGITIGAAFVGAVAAALTLSEPLRLLNRGTSYEAIAFSLRSPERIDAAARPDSPAPRFGHVVSNKPPMR
jgi:hypothetical protein